MADGTNLYTYAMNNPPSLVDRTGAAVCYDGGGGPMCSSITLVFGRKSCKRSVCDCSSTHRLGLDVSFTSPRRPRSPPVVILGPAIADPHLDNGP